MNFFIDLILENIVFFLIILFAILNMIGRMKNENEQKRERRERIERPVEMEKRTQHNKSKVEQKPKLTRAEQLAKETAEQELKSIEEQRQKQVERLKRKFQSSYTLDEVEQVDLASGKRQIEMNTKLKLRENGKYYLNLENRFTRKGLIESVIMAEVLGPPKARNRIRNRYVKRRF